MGSNVGPGLVVKSSLTQPSLAGCQPRQASRQARGRAEGRHLSGVPGWVVRRGRGVGLAVCLVAPLSVVWCGGVV